MKDKYRIIKLIATGGMATIYKAEQISLSRPVIIKKLHPHLASDEEFVKRFKREAKILGKLKHKNIVEIIDFYKKNGDYFIVLEFVEGKSLEQLIKEVGPLPINIAKFVVSEVASGLGAAHKNGILHRDVKPSNVMVGKDGTIKISDFGLALSLGGTEITEPGATIGTPAYLAPELVKGGRASQGSDIYSLGLLFYEIITGRNPFKGKNRFETINNILYKKLPPVHLPNSIENKMLIRIITKMTRSDPKIRYKDIDTILYDLSPYNILTQKDFAEFLTNPAKEEAIMYKEKRFSQEIFIYLSLLALTVLITVFIILGKKRIQKYDNFNTVTLVYHKASPKDTSNNNKIETTITHKNSIQTPHKNSNIVEIVNPPITQKDSYGYIKPVVKPWAKIFIDNIFYGNTPLSEPIKLPTGSHTITFKHPNRKEFTESITIVKEETLKINTVLEEVFGYLKITVTPWAEIYIDGEKKGITPIAKPFRLTSGEHLLQLKKGNSLLWQKTIKILTEDTLLESINLE